MSSSQQLSRSDLAALAMAGFALSEIYKQRSQEFLYDRTSKDWYKQEAERMAKAAIRARDSLEQTR